MQEDYVATKFTSNRFNIRNKTIIESNGINFECEIRFDENANDASTWSTSFVCIIIIIIRIIDNNEWSTKPRAKLLLLCVRESSTKYVLVPYTVAAHTDHGIDKNPETSCHRKIGSFLSDREYIFIYLLCGYGLRSCYTHLHL